MESPKSKISLKDHLQNTIASELSRQQKQKQEEQALQQQVQPNQKQSLPNSPPKIENASPTELDRTNSQNLRGFLSASSPGKEVFDADTKDADRDNQIATRARRTKPFIKQLSATIAEENYEEELDDYQLDTIDEGDTSSRLKPEKSKNAPETRQKFIKLSDEADLDLPLRRRRSSLTLLGEVDQSASTKGASVRKGSDNVDKTKGVLFTGANLDQHRELKTTYDAIMRKKNLTNNLHKIPEKKEKPEEFSRPRSFTRKKTTNFNKYRDPLEEIDLEEKSIKDTTNVQDSLQYFYVTNSPLKNFKIVITEFAEENELSELYYSKREGTEFGPHGKATAIAVFPSKYIIIGTQLGYIDVYSHSRVLLFSLYKKGTPRSAVYSLDISDKGFYLAAGFANGTATVWSLKTQNDILSITPDPDTPHHDSAVKIVRIWQESPLCLLSCDSDGKLLSTRIVSEYLIKHKTFEWIIKERAIPVSNIAVLNREIKGFHSEERTGISQHIVAITTLDSVLIISMDPKVEILHKVPRPELIEENQIPHISWGHGIFKSKRKKINLYLAVGWGKHIFLIEVNVLPVSRTRFELLGYLPWETNIMHINWIGTSLMAIIDDEKHLHIVNSEDFLSAVNLTMTPRRTSTSVPGSASSSRRGSFARINTVPMSKGQDNDEKEPATDEDKVLKYTEPLPYLMCSQSIGFIKGYEEAPVHLMMTNTVVISSESHEMHFLTQDKVRSMRLMDWMEYLNSLTAQQYWAMFLTIAVDIFHGNFHEVHSIPLYPEEKMQKMIPYFHDKLLEFIDFHLLRGKGEDMQVNKADAKRVIMCVIDFCLDVKMNVILFTTIRKALGFLGLSSKFIKYLEPFINCNRIKEIPWQALTELIEYYYNHDKSTLMQKVLVNIDMTLLSEVDIKLITESCCKYKLYMAYMYITRQIQRDYISPFTKLIGDYQLAVENKKLDEMKKLGYGCLWYLKLCFKGRALFTEERIEEEVWERSVLDIAAIAYTRTNLRLLFQIDLKLMINLTLYLLIGEPSVFFEKNMGKVTILDFEKDYGVLTEENENAKNIYYQLYEVIVYFAKLYSNEKTDRESREGYLYYMISKMAASARFNFINKKKCFNALIFLLQNPFCLDNDFLTINFKTFLPLKDEQGKAINFMKEIDEKVDHYYIYEERNKALMDLLKFIEDDNLSQEKITELFVEAVKSP